MLGVQTALLPVATWEEGLALCRQLAREGALRACEVHLAGDEYAAATPPTPEAARRVRDELGPGVADLGVHLPFAPLPADGATPDALRRGLDFAAECGAARAVLHLRGVPRDEQAWAGACAPLTARARERGIDLLLENADDLRDFGAVARVAALAGAGTCLDVGHLYERVYPPRGLGRKGLVANDRWSPRPFAIRTALPGGAGAGGWVGLAREAASAAGAPACVHLHDHDGRRAHARPRRGRLRWERLADLRAAWATVPVILEADFRAAGADDVRADLAFLGEALGS